MDPILAFFILGAVVNPIIAYLIYANAGRRVRLPFCLFFCLLASISYVGGVLHLVYRAIGLV